MSTKQGGQLILTKLIQIKKTSPQPDENIHLHLNHTQSHFLLTSFNRYNVRKPLLNSKQKMSKYSD